MAVAREVVLVAALLEVCLVVSTGAVEMAVGMVEASECPIAGGDAE
jgi:hypothetical protein